jgi:hypothetical protein
MDPVEFGQVLWQLDGTGLLVVSFLPELGQLGIKLAATSTFP